MTCTPLEYNVDRGFSKNITYVCNCSEMEKKRRHVVEYIHTLQCRVRISLQLIQYREDVFSGVVMYVDRKRDKLHVNGDIERTEREREKTISYSESEENE